MSMTADDERFDWYHIGAWNILHLDEVTATATIKTVSTCSALLSGKPTKLYNTVHLNVICTKLTLHIRRSKFKSIQKSPCRVFWLTINVCHKPTNQRHFQSMQCMHK